MRNPKGKPRIVNTIQKNILLWFFVNKFLVNFFWICIRGTLAAINVKANKLHTLKIPTIIYSWNIAETKNVSNYAISEGSPLLING